MAREKVDISVDADTARAIANLTEIVRKQAEIGDAAEKAGRKGAVGAREFAAQLEGVVGKWTSVTHGIEMAVAAIKSVISESNKLRAESVGATRSIDSGLTGYRIAQGNLSPDAGLNAADRISQVAQQTKSSNQAAFEAASLLARYGVGRDEAEGPALSELLQLQDLTQAQGTMDPGAISRGVLNALQRSKRPITGQNIRQFGGAAFGLSRQIKGFDEGEVGITADVATYGRQAGLVLEETMAIVGSLSEAYGEGGAKKRFRSLFKDHKHSMAENEEIRNLRERARGLLRGGGSDYAGALGIAGSSMTDDESQAQAAYEASGYRPGILDSETVRKRFLAARRSELGTSAIDNALQGARFDMLNWLGGPEYAVNNMTSGFGSGPTDPAAARIRERALGKQEFTVRLLTPDGRDIPAQQEADALNQNFSNDATQTNNFRP